MTAQKKHQDAAHLKKFDVAGKEIGSITIDDIFTNASANSQMVKDYIIAIRANARQWSASTKGRSEVAHTTKKPHPQKGTGRARQGSLVSPQFRGGGIVFGPKPKFDQHVKINKKERQAAIRFLLAEKMRNNQVVLIDNTKIKKPHTKTVASFLKSCGAAGRALFLGEGEHAEINVDGIPHKVSVASKHHEHWIKSVRNLPKVEFSLATNISGYDVMLARHIIMTEKAYHEIVNWLK